MNPVIKLLNERKSVRDYEDKKISEDIKEAIIKAAMRAPTAGNMMLYSIVEITEQKTKDTLVKTCDNQPFIAKAPLVLLFLADYQRWYDYFKISQVEEICKEKNTKMRKPQEGDLFLACCDALIAAQNAVIAAESYGIGSCYIGDIMENYEIHKELFDLPEYTFPIALLCFGYPSKREKDRQQTERFDKKYIVFRDKYKRLTEEDFDQMYNSLLEKRFKNANYLPGAKNLGQHYYLRKFDSDFSLEMSRSVSEALKNWMKD